MAISVSTPVFQWVLWMALGFMAIFMVLFLSHHRRFPIAQRLPFCVLVENLFLGFTIFLLLFPMGYAQSQTGQYLNRCSVWQIMISWGDHIPVAIISFRMTYLSNRYFTTKLFVKNQDLFAHGKGIAARRQGSESISSEEHVEYRVRELGNIVFEKYVVKYIGMYGPTWFSIMELSPAYFLMLVDGCRTIAIVVSIQAIDSDGLLCYRLFSVNGMFIKDSVWFYLAVLAVWGRKVTMSMHDSMYFHLELKLLYIVLFLGGVLLIPNSFGRDIQLAYDPLWRVLMVSFMLVPLFFIQTALPVCYCFYHMKKSKGAMRVKIKNQQRTHERLEMVLKMTKTPTLSSTIDQLMTIIHDSRGRDAMLRFLESEFAVENLLFIEACESFEKKCASEERVSMDQVYFIVDNFIHNNAPSCVNISYQMRDKILNQVQEAGKAGDPAREIDVDIFAEAKREVIHVLATEAFRRFQVSDPYQELKSQLQAETVY
eukprot:TRINITY_DN7205_c0_g1_i2.p1 TRINITY_DN7205_c0_g1~~TRINITY_DN7205_c0_g1_i2.p1  ORF type:complete len:497 (-),score=108.19 TRINITY_DN7205_c0_g1_i2:352-1803(-)